MALLFTIKGSIHLTLFFHYRFLVSTFFCTHTNTQEKQRNTKNVDSHSTCDDPLCVRRLRATPKSLRRSPTFNIFYFVCSCVFFLQFKPFSLWSKLFENLNSLFLLLHWISKKIAILILYFFQEKKKVDLKAGVVCDQNGVWICLRTHCFILRLCSYDFVINFVMIWL